MRGSSICYEAQWAVYGDTPSILFAEDFVPYFPDYDEYTEEMWRKMEDWFLEGSEDVDVEYYPVSRLNSTLTVPADWFDELVQMESLTTDVIAEWIWN